MLVTSFEAYSDDGVAATEEESLPIAVAEDRTVVLPIKFSANHH
ncbi:hypothetical protein A2U01_0004599 [Trifolium medium]|uniref:Uncharacterized protein n=1 Tax=Trifolium medium TaxID=97028 RepID=A0A392M9G6_9FABA|nr:hypothetical protein [Trifolium medium]